MLSIDTLRHRVFRNQERDAQSDLQRAEMVAAAVTKALSSIDFEIVGLGRRVEELRTWVGGLLDSISGGSDQRSKSAEADLIAAEGQLMQGVKRLEDLASKRIIYRDLQAAIEREHALEAARVKI